MLCISVFQMYFLNNELVFLHLEVEANSSMPNIFPLLQMWNTHGVAGP